MKYTGLDSAIALAATMFQGVYDKSGQPYILHCIQVMYNVLKYNDVDLQIAAILHDIIEDTPVDEKQLITMGYSPRVIEIIKAVTFPKDCNYDDKILEICNSQDAIKVKMADLEHNSSILRLKGIRQKDLERIKKYHKSYFILKAHLD